MVSLRTHWDILAQDLRYVAARGMTTLLFGIRTDDPMTFSLVAAVCFVTAVAACVRPALRAAGIHPMSGLRSD
jgi:ABC-type lipoprotein release transport system permease subunit